MRNPAPHGARAVIASTALELFLLGLAVWQLIVVRRSLRADRERAAQERQGAE